MKTFILFWNPAISTWKLEDCKSMIDREESFNSFDSIWSVWEHEQAHEGHRFFMVRCGEGNTGICESGHFSSEPHRGEDWSGKGREVYYVELDIDVMIDTESCPILTTDILQREMPDFDWTGGHSGRVLPAKYEEKIESLWNKFLDEHESIFHRHAIRQFDPEDEEWEDDVEKEDDDRKIRLMFSLQDDGCIETELIDPHWCTIGRVVARTLKETTEKALKILSEKSISLPLDNYDYKSRECYFNDVIMAQFVKAVDLASSKHRDQTDKAGKPYFGHVVRVSKKCKTPPTKVVALLHDIVEDTDVTLDMLEELGFSEFIIKAVSCLTHQEGESYEDYVRRAAKNPISREVKLADLEDNMDIRRLEFITEEDLSRLDKYRIAWKYLNDYNK